MIETAELKLTIILKVTNDPAKAVAQVVVKKEDAEREFQRRISIEVDKQLAIHERELKAQFEVELAERVAQHTAMHEHRNAERNSDHIIVRVTQLVRIGDRGYLFFTIQNRSRQSYRLASVKVIGAGGDMAGTVVFAGKAASGEVLGEVQAGGTAAVMVAVPALLQLSKDAVDLQISEPRGARAVRVANVDLP